MEQSPKNSDSGPNFPSMSIPGNERNPWGLPNRSNVYHASTDTSLFSTSLPVFPHGKFRFNESRPSLDDEFPILSKVRHENDIKGTIQDIEPNLVGNFLPDDEEELFAGLVDDFDFSRLPTQLEELDDDFFGSGGGLEIDSESQDNLVNGISRFSMSNGINGNIIPQVGLANGVGSVSGEHPYGEHPSRTLFVRNINSNVEDSELKTLFEQHGDIRTLYTACKHRGFVMISYYDIRSARNAMRGLQNKPLRRRKLDIHFSIPKDNPPEKDINQGTLVVFNLDASVSNDDLRQIFGAYGEVKEIRETPHKRHHKFIEFYDVRAAEAALKTLNRCDIAGKRIKLEPSRPGGARRSLIQLLTQDQEQDEARAFRHQVGSPIGNSPPGNWPNFGSPIEHNTLHGYSQTPSMGSLSPVGSNHLPGLASILSTRASNPLKIAPIGKDPSRISHVNHQHPFSVPDLNLSSSPGPVSQYGDSSKPSSIGTISLPQFLWGSPTFHLDHINNSSARQFPSSGQRMGFPYTSQHGSFLGSHHVGSAPSGIQLEKHFGFFPESPEISYMNHTAFESTNFGRNGMNIGTPGGLNMGVAYAGNFLESGSPSTRMMSMLMPMPRNGSLYFGNGSLGSFGVNGNDGIDRGRVKRAGDSGSPMDNKKQYQLDLNKIINGEDIRTTLMIKNIPNKYTSKMLLLAIDETHKGTYDFLYLPIDFKNKCNVGYAFINMVSPSHIVTFYEAFNGKKWEKFNSEKVASLAYARIQGKTALISHFQNSSLINEDKCCRPIVFHSEGQGTDYLEPFLTGNLNIFIRQPDGSYAGDTLDSPEADPDERL